jgi:DNA-binding IclR family transcriptional regulator
MSIPRHTFNILPPKPAYLSKVLKALETSTDLSEKEIVSQTGLTKTQALCALVELVKSGRVEKIESTKRYSLIEGKG